MVCTSNMLLYYVLLNHVCVCSFSYVPFFVTSWNVAHPAPLSMEFSRQEYCSGLPFLSPGYLPKPGIKCSLLHCGQTIYCLSHKGSPNIVCPKSLSHVWLSVTLWTVALQDPLFMEFSKQEYWNRLLCPPPGLLPNPGIEPTFLKSPALAGGFFTN